MKQLTTMPAEAPGTQLAPSSTPHDFLRMAVERGADMAQIEKFMDLADRWDATQARKAFVQAMTDFKSEPLKILKDKHVKFTTQKGVTEYDHATLASVVETVVQGMAKHGLSHRWTVTQADRITVTCVITHQLGHSESVALTASADDSGGKNNIQSVASTITYLQRYTLMAACGLAARDQQDDDGRGAEVEYVDEKQMIEINDLLAAIKEKDPKAEAGFLRYMDVEYVAAIRADKYQRAIDVLKQTLKVVSKGGAK